MKTAGKNDAKYRIILTAMGNPDYFQNCNSQVCEPLTVYSDTIEELSSVMRNWIRENSLGAGNISKTIVLENHSNKKIGMISYNGKFWERGSKYFPN